MMGLLSPGEFLVHPERREKKLNLKIQITSMVHRHYTVLCMYIASQQATSETRVYSDVNFFPDSSPQLPFHCII